MLLYLQLACDHLPRQMQFGDFLLARGQAQPAVEDYERAVLWDSNSAALRHELAIALSQVGRNHDAVAALEQAARLDPNEPQYAFALGLAYNEAGDVPAAIAAFERAVVLQPDLTRVWYNLGLARAHAGDLAGALAALAHVEAALPGDPDVARVRAMALARLR